MGTAEEVFSILDGFLEDEGAPHPADRRDSRPTQQSQQTQSRPWPIHSRVTPNKEALPERFGSNSLHGSQPEWQWPDSTMDHGLTGPSLFLEPRHLDIPTDRMASLHSSQPGSLPARASFDSPLPGKANGEEETASGKSFKELHAERNKQAQRRFRKRQKEKLGELHKQLSKLEAERAELETRRALLDSACRLRDEELSKVAARQKMHSDMEEDSLSRAFQGGVTLTFREEETITLDPAQIKDMSDRDLARYWSNYVKEIAVLLVSVEGDPSPPQGIVARIQELVQKELLFLYIRAALTNMQSVKRFIAKAKIEEVRVTAGAVPATNRWKEICVALDLKPHQAADICGLWKELQGKVSELFEKRVKIHKGLASMSHSGRCGREFAEEYLKAHNLMDQLKKSLREEHLLIHEFLVTFFLSKLTPIQMARCFVRSFPFYPDIPAIAAWISVSQNDSLALSKLPVMEAASPASSS